MRYIRILALPLSFSHAVLAKESSASISRACATLETMGKRLYPVTGASKAKALRSKISQKLEHHLQRVSELSGS